MPWMVGSSDEDEEEGGTGGIPRPELTAECAARCLSWSSGSGSGGYGSSDELDPDFAIRFCTNCTAMLDGFTCGVRRSDHFLLCRMP